MKYFRLSLYFFLGLLLGASVSLSYAATIPYKFNGMNVTREAGVTHLRGTSPAEVAAAGVTVENAAIRASGSANWYSGTGALVENGAVVFNAVIPIAATAASVAVTAVRANPTGLITTAVASYLLSKGIEYAEGQFVKQTEGQQIGTCYTPDGNSQSNSSRSACVATVKPMIGGGTCTFHSWYNNERGMNWACPGFGILSGGTFMIETTVPGQKVPLNESDWDAARVGYWPDPAILDLVRKGVPLPTDKPVFSPTQKDVPLSDPYVDPVTGKRFQDKARITPSPSNPDQADVQIVKQEVDANGQPVTNPSTGGEQAPEKQEDPCKLNPDASACKPLDDVPDNDMLHNEITLSISPVSGFGPDNGTCPASKTLFTKGGQPIVWSWQMYCDFASGIRPLIIGFAYLSALLIVVGVARRNT